MRNLLAVAAIWGVSTLPAWAVIYDHGAAPAADAAYTRDVAACPTSPTTTGIELLNCLTAAETRFADTIALQRRDLLKAHLGRLRAAVEMFMAERQPGSRADGQALGAALRKQYLQAIRQADAE